jgi:hypothetical protein
VADIDKDELPHVTTTLESDYDMSQWHIARISHRSNCECHVQQAATKVKCIARIARAPKALLLLHTRIGKFNMVATKRLSQTSGFAPITLSVV